MAFKRLENELKHSHSSGERKEQDFSMAIKARDDALKEVEKIRKQLEIAEERERRNVSLHPWNQTRSFRCQMCYFYVSS